MKNLAIFFSLFVLLLPLSAAETKIFSGKIITGTDKVIDGGTFRFTYDENSRKALVQTPAGGLIVENGACKPNNVFRVCLNSANFSYKNITTYVYYYEVDATIYKLTGSLSTISKSILNTLLQGESTELAVTITNPTEFDITDIILNYDLSPFYVIEAKGCELDYRQMAWKGTLKPKYDKTCTASIIAEREGKYSLTGNLSYFNGFEAEKKVTDALAITVLPKQLKVSQFIEKNIEVKKPFYFNISMQNIHSTEDINLLAAITLPGHAALIKDTPSFEKDARVMKNRLILKPKTYLNYSIYMEKLSEGTEPINLRFEYSIKGINDMIENSTFIDVIAIKPESKPVEPKIESEVSNETQINESRINVTAVNEGQIPQPISENKTEAKPDGNKTNETVEMRIETPKSNFFSRKFLLLGAVVFAILLIAVFVIYGMRKREKGVVDTQLEKKALEEISERLDEVDKPKTF